VQASGAEVVVALTHMRVPNDVKLAQAVPEIDAVLGGHDHHVQVGCNRFPDAVQCLSQTVCGWFVDDKAVQQIGERWGGGA
jgi:2',3'-cyclic-nucleotide 2'-phosphodiesterase (5'-nucleotidase family)